MKKFLKQTVDKFLGFFSLLLGALGTCLAVGMVYIFGKILYMEYQKHPFNFEGFIIVIVILSIMIGVATLISYTPKLFKFGIRKLLNK